MATSGQTLGRGRTVPARGTGLQPRGSFREPPLPANLRGVNTARGMKAPGCRQRPKGLVGPWQLKVQISLPYCSLRSAEDVLNGSESPCNHGWCVPAAVYHQALLWVKQSLEGESAPHRFLLARAGSELAACPSQAEQTPHLACPALRRQGAALARVWARWGKGSPGLTPALLLISSNNSV